MSSIISSLLLVLLGFCLLTGIQAQDGVLGPYSGVAACASYPFIVGSCTQDSLNIFTSTFGPYVLIPDEHNPADNCIGNLAPSVIPTSSSPDIWPVFVDGPNGGTGTNTFSVTAVASGTTCTLYACPTAAFCITGGTVTTSLTSTTATAATGVYGYLSCYSSTTSMLFVVGDVNNGVSNARQIQATTGICTSIIVGDPQFSGFRGQSYQIHGIDGAYYNLITSKLTQVNAGFTFLSEGKCPIINGFPASNCWSHPGSYLGVIGVQQMVDGKLQQLRIEAGSAKEGFASIRLNDAEIKVGQSLVLGSFSFNFTSSHSIVVEAGDFTFFLDNSDMFINQVVNVNVPLSRLSSHGLLGQTHSLKIYPNQWKYIEGDVDNYVVSDIFASDFVYNQFRNS